MATASIHQMSTPRSFLLSLVLLVLLLAVPHAAIAQTPRTLTLMTPGTTFNTGFVGLSEDGTRVIFSSSEQLVPQDTDTAVDFYERHNGTTRLISGGTANEAPTFHAISGDGQRVFFSTREALLPADTDDKEDLYVRRVNGTLALVTSGARGVFDVFTSRDGSRVVFGTDQPLLPGDTDTAADVYERRETGELRLLSPGNANIDAAPVGMSRDGTRVLFITDEALITGQDTDTARDLYERHADGTLRLISTGGANQDIESVATSEDGSRVFFETPESIPGTGDFDGAIDVYERRLDGSLHLVTNGTGASFNAERIEHVSADGSRLTFVSLNELVPEDTDGGRDVYQRLGDGTLRLISTVGTADTTSVVGASDDGTVVYFSTKEQIPGMGDTDNTADIYRRGADGAVHLVSGGTQDLAPTGHAVSSDGARVFFSTEEGISPLDNNNHFEPYEGAPGVAPRLLGIGSDLGGQPGFFVGAARDGSRVIFQTSEAIVGTGDNDAGRDLYERAWTEPGFGTPASVTGTPQVGQTLTCVIAVIADGATETIEWLRDGERIAGATGPTYVPVDADAGTAVSCRVVAANVIGRATQTSPAVGIPAPPVPPAPEVPAPAPIPPAPPLVPAPPVGVGTPVVPADTRRPVVRLRTATCPSKIRRNTTKCRRYRTTVAAWRTLRGTVTDAAPSSGISRVTVGVVRRSGKRCLAFTGRRFSSMSCTAAAKRTQTVRLTRGALSLNLRGLAPGRHTIRIVATDRAGNRATLTRTVTIRRR